MEKRDHRTRCSLETFHSGRGFVKLWGRLLVIGVFLWMGLLIGVSKSEAATLHVDCLTGTIDGSNGYYKTISGAVAAAVVNDTIRIHAGTCEESITININKAGLKILGDNPSNTIVTHPSSLASVDVFTISASSVEIAGLTITGSGNGIYINAGSASIHNNHINT